MSDNKKLPRTRKTRIKRMPQGAVKSEILLLVANKPGGVNTVEIKEHLRDEFKIKNKKNLLTHLSDLTKKGLLFKKFKPTEKHSGVPDIFYIKEGSFSTLQNLFEYFKETQNKDKFITTKYFSNYISSEDFRIKYTVYLLKNMILNTVGNAGDDGSIVDFFIYSFKEEKDIKEIKTLLNGLKNYDFSKSKYNKITDLAEIIKTYGIKRRDNKQLLINLISILKTANVDELTNYIASYSSLTKMLLKRAPNLIIPEKEREEILTMLKFSPSAVEFVLSDPKDILNLFMGFTLRKLINDPKKENEFLDLIDKKDRNYFRIFDLLADFSNIENKSPFYTAISSKFLSDYFNTDLIPPENDEEWNNNKLLQSLFVPKFKVNK